MTRATARTSPARTTSARTTSARTTSTPPRGTATAPRGTGTAPRTAARPPRAVPSRPELRLVPDATPRPRGRVRSGLGSRRAPFVLLVVALLVGTTLGLLILNTAIAVDSLKATQLRAANAERDQLVQRLQQQVVSGGTPEQVASAAVAAGLVPAGPAAFLVIAADGSSTLRGTPEPAKAPPPPVTPSSAGQSPGAQSPAAQSPAAQSPAARPATPSPAAPSPATGQAPATGAAGEG